MRRKDSILKEVTDLKKEFIGRKITDIICYTIDDIYIFMEDGALYVLTNTSISSRVYGVEISLDTFLIPDESKNSEILDFEMDDDTDTEWDEVELHLYVDTLGGRIRIELSWGYDEWAWDNGDLPTYELCQVIQP